MAEQKIKRREKIKFSLKFSKFESIDQFVWINSMNFMIEFTKDKSKPF